VLENLKTAQHARVRYDAGTGLVGGARVRAEERALEAKADAILELLGLTAVRHHVVGGLPYGTLKLLELGCALATEPDVLLLDEPSSGMGPEESHQLGERLLDLRRAFGLTMLLIEHHVPLVLSVCDHVYVLNFGRLLAAGQPSVIQTHPEVVAAYLGGEAPEALASTRETPDQEALDASLQPGTPEAESATVPAPRPAPRTKSAPRKQAAPGRKAAAGTKAGTRAKAAPRKRPAGGTGGEAS
jgi:branched-chain amino acid transport system ATP-binding protein